MGKWNRNVQLTLKQMRTAVLELALCQAKLQLQIRHPAWLSDRKPAPDLAALLRFSTTGGLFKAVERIHENRLFHFLFQHQRCKEASTQPRNGAVSQLGFSEHLTDRYPCSDRALQLLGLAAAARGQLSGSFSVLCAVLWSSAQWYKCFWKLAWRDLFCDTPSVPCTNVVPPTLWENCSWFAKCVTQMLPLCLANGGLGQQCAGTVGVVPPHLMDEQYSPFTCDIVINDSKWDSKNSFHAV